MIFAKLKKSCQIIILAYTFFVWFPQVFAPEPSADCSSEVTLDTYQTVFIRIPSARENYGNNLRCEMKIHNSNVNDSITINTGSFDVEKSNGCEFDYLEIEEPCAGKSYRFCGFMGPVVHQSECPSIAVRFVSDSSDSKKGFQISANGEKHKQYHSYVQKILTAS